MSKVGLSRRLTTIGESIKAHDPLSYAVHHLPPKLRACYDAWKADCERITAQSKVNEYEAMLDGQQLTPPMPPDVAAAIGTDRCLNTITADMTLSEIQDRWQRILEEGQ